MLPRTPCGGKLEPPPPPPPPLQRCAAPAPRAGAGWHVALCDSHVFHPSIRLSLLSVQPRWFHFEESSFYRQSTVALGSQRFVVKHSESRSCNMSFLFVDFCEKSDMVIRIVLLLCGCLSSCWNEGYNAVHDTWFEAEHVCSVLFLCWLFTCLNIILTMTNYDAE